MPPFAETIAFVFGLVGLGYLAGWTGLLKTEIGDALANFVFVIAVPLLLFRTMSSADMVSATPWALWLTYFAAVAVSWAFGQWTITRVFGREQKAGIVGGVAAAFSNLVLLGIPFMLGVYGHKGFEILSLLIGVHLPIMMATSIILFELANSGDDGFAPGRAFLKFMSGLFRNPLIIGILAGLIWRLSGLQMPSLGNRLVDALADVAGPVALFSMGLGLRKFGFSGNIKPALAIAGIKLFVMPAIALAVALAIGLPPMTSKVAVAAASLASGVNPYLIATRFGTGQALASNAATASTAFAVVTTAAWLAIAQVLFG
jgi:malonate transporter